MERSETKQKVKKLLDKYGYLFSKEAGIKVEKGTPSELFKWLCASKLYSARISSEISTNAAKNLVRKKYSTPQKMKNSTWEERVKGLNEAHYTRYQERTSTFLGDTAEKVVNEFNGDIRKIREKAGKDPKKERKLLKEFKGIGDVGVDVFFREVQTSWKELYPFADKKALKAAKKIGLPSDAEKLAMLVKEKDFPRLLAALVRADLNKDYKLQAA